MHTYYGAIKGHQGGFDYYSVQVPFSSLSSNFVFENSEIMEIEDRCQREINLGRAKKFATYINENPSAFVTGAVVGTVDEQIEFIPLSGEFATGDVGVIKVPADYRIVLCDGQHRQKGIELALSEKNELANHTLPVILYSASCNTKKQQIFADLNTKSVKPSSSLAITFDHRSSFLRFVKSITKELPYLKKVIEFERSSVSPKSKRLWPLVSFKTFIVNLTGLTESNFDSALSDDRSREILKETVVNFIEGLSNLRFWYEITQGKADLQKIRENTIVSHAVFLEALGLYGNQLMQKFDAIGQIDWTLMRKLQEVPIEKTEWVGRCVSPQMTIVKNQFGIKSTAAKICLLTETELSEALAEANNLVI
jgi:DNA sulfur modification protein DndB